MKYAILRAAVISESVSLDAFKEGREIALIPGLTVARYDGINQSSYGSLSIICEKREGFKARTSLSV